MTEAITVTEEEARGLELVVGASWNEWDIPRQEAALVVVRNLLAQDAGRIYLGASERVQRPALALVVPESPVSVVQALARVKARVPHVGKDRRVQGRESYAYRGIDDILAAVQRHSAEEGVVIVPRDLEVRVEPWTYYQGESWRLYTVKMEWTIYGPDGSSIKTENWGEALDNSDKALGKARSYAQKDLLVRLYEIPTGDPDFGDTEAGATPFRTPDENVEDLADMDDVLTVLAVLEEILALTDGRYPREWTEHGYPRRESLEAIQNGERPPFALAALPLMLQALDSARSRIEDAAVEGGEPDGPSGGPALSGRDVLDPDKVPPGALGPDDRCQICGSTRARLAEVEGVWRCQDAKGCAERVHKREVEEATEGIDCAVCGGTIVGEEPLVWDKDERPVHPECLDNPIGDSDG